VIHNAEEEVVAINYLVRIHREEQRLNKLLDAMLALGVMH
jgi:rRNA pseudouridine-1189 N-methylase Emg1 (Nep1/Mra1 family)